MILLIPQVLCPHACNIDCIAATDNMRWVLTGGADGIVRKYDFFGSLNGKVTLTPQKGQAFETTKVNR